MITNLTEGKPSRVLWRFSMPMLLSILFQQLYNMADSAVVGRFVNENALSAVGVSYPITMIFMAVAAGSSVGGSVVISRLFGGGEVAQMRTAIGTTLWSMGAVSVVLTVVGLVFCPQLLALVDDNALVLKDGTDVTIIAVGMNVQMSLKAAELLAAEGISARVIDMHTIKPLDTELVLKAAQETGCIVTTEEANVLGGLGAAVCEYLSGTCPVPVVRHGVNDEFGRSGKAPLVLEAYGITAEKIAEDAKKAISMKK